MFSKMSGQRVVAESSAQVPLDIVLTEGVRGAPDVGVLASADRDHLAVMVWHYHDDDVPGPDAAVDLAVAGLPASVGEAELTHYRIDEHHSNAYAAWKRMGSPVAPDRGQYAMMQAAARLALMDAPARLGVVGGEVSLRFTLPRQAVSLVFLEWS
jgi:xylan 1,4-beta-xylosidase